MIGKISTVKRIKNKKDEGRREKLIKTKKKLFFTNSSKNQLKLSVNEFICKNWHARTVASISTLNWNEIFYLSWASEADGWILMEEKFVSCELKKIGENQHTNTCIPTYIIMYAIVEDTSKML